LAQRVDGEVAFRVFLLVDNGGGKRLLICLPLENLFFDGAGGYESVDEAWSDGMLT
jgi:hypothetical protein